MEIENEKQLNFVYTIYTYTETKHKQIHWEIKPKLYTNFRERNIYR